MERDIDGLKEEIFKKKQQLEKFKQSIKEKNVGIIDQYTQIDELLRYQLQEQRKSNDYLDFIARVLYQMYLQGGTVQGQGSPGNIEPIEFGAFSTLYRTKVKYFNSPIGLGTSKQLFRLEGSGFVSEVKLVSSNSDVNNKLYSIRIKCDDNIIYDDSFLNFQDRSLSERDVTAYEDTNNSFYSLHFQTFFYIYNFSVELYNSSAQFQLIYIKYHEEV